MPHKVYLLVYPSPLFPVHWALWIPSDRIDGAGTTLGKGIHVTGRA
jgi:hypothetical protein